ncbi:hypothetical protein GGS21DRAFT_492363 [Xylaria nigripes]|nr:hypothetical protein GGS21DRAFT_492363 [Xylaria nigripes]
MRDNESYIDESPASTNLKLRFSPIDILFASLVMRFHSRCYGVDTAFHKPLSRRTLPRSDIPNIPKRTNLARRHDDTDAIEGGRTIDRRLYTQRHSQASGITRLLFGTASKLVVKEAFVVFSQEFNIFSKESKKDLSMPLLTRNSFKKMPGRPLNLIRSVARSSQHHSPDSSLISHSYGKSPRSHLNRVSFATKRYATMSLVSAFENLRVTTDDHADEMQGVEFYPSVTADNTDNESMDIDLSGVPAESGASEQAIQSGCVNDCISTANDAGSTVAVTDADGDIAMSDSNESTSKLEGHASPAKKSRAQQRKKRRVASPEATKEVKGPWTVKTIESGALQITNSGQGLKGVTVDIHFAFE